MKRSFLTTLLLLLCSCYAFAGPYITAAPAVLNSFNYNPGNGPSETKVVVVQSSLLAPSAGAITVTCPGDYEVSLDNMSFAGTASIPYSNDTLAPTNLYIRLKAGLPLGDYNLQTISLSCPSASTTVSASGSVTAQCNVLPGAITASSAAFSWNNTGALLYECKVDQSAGAPTTSGVANTSTNYTQQGLTANTSYFFHVRGNVGNNNFTNWTNVPFSTATTSINNTATNQYQLRNAPNPSNGSFVISGASKDEIHIAVCNTIGQAVYNAVAKPSNGSFSYPVQLPSSIPGGLYLLHISGREGSYATGISVVR